MTCTADLKVVKAAIRTDEGDVFSVDVPGRHHDVIKIIRDSGYEGPVSGDRQGFLLSNGMFVRRKPALFIALKAKQTIRSKCVAPGIGLFSEDLW